MHRKKREQLLKIGAIAIVALFLLDKIVFSPAMEHWKEQSEHIDDLRDKVTKGQVVAKLGNTGNANAPHLHLQIMNGPSPVASPSIPYVIDSFGYQDQISPQRIYEADNYLTGNFFGPHPYRAPETRTNQLPMAWTIVNFPG